MRQGGNGRDLTYVGREYNERQIADLIRHPNLSHREMADLIGISRKTLIRELSRFEKCGFIKLENKRITLIDREKLRLLTEA